MTYNVRGLRHGVDRVAAVIEVDAPDVLMVQESGPRRSLRRLARTVGMTAARDPWSPFRRRIKNAVLVRPPFRISSATLVRFSPSERWYPRGALVAEVRHPGGAFRAVSVHLGLRPRARRRHAAELEALGRGLGTPLVIGADLNEGPDGPTPNLLARTFTDAWARVGSDDGATIVVAGRPVRIDYLFVSADVEAETCRVPSDADALAASDHLPVIADVRMP